ncbi:hypothetical protein ANCDUO_18960 [Ancylostoma duodenale]|uniref:Uncharacterized protein n=1 Tax=Ancylostoma duodenale TaxID=51022 RepID=A0A0C2C3U5_9BILA|nr:hypothetical protein ANCDUO_18960 [Ancylostoma duodenale]
MRKKYENHVDFNAYRSCDWRSLLVDAVVVFHWIDDRLVLRELFDDFELPKEFEPWLPRVRTIPAPHTVTVVLSPATGVVSLYHR